MAIINRVFWKQRSFQRSDYSAAHPAMKSVPLQYMRATSKVTKFGVLYIHRQKKANGEVKKLCKLGQLVKAFPTAHVPKAKNAPSVLSFPKDID